MIHTSSLGELFDRVTATVVYCPWQAHAGIKHAAEKRGLAVTRRGTAARMPLYTPAQRQRRDLSKWTLVQGILAPLQFLVFLISLWLVLQYLATGDGLAAASASVVIKTLFLYAIMITGSLWERDVFGKYLFAGPFFWEDVVSMAVLALHTAYLVALFTGALPAQQQMYLALAAYVAYVINATQFVLKLRAARLQSNEAAALHDQFAGQPQ